MSNIPSYPEKVETPTVIQNESFESGAASGWPGTDWLEDLMLRSAGPNVYDKWVNHEISFDDAEVLIDAKGLSHKGTIKPFDLQIHKGEVVGLTGLLGSGRSELARVIYGADKNQTGTLKVNGKEVKIKGMGKGLLDAFVNAFAEYAGTKFSIEMYSEHAMKSGTDSAAITYIEIVRETDGKVFIGAGVSSSVTKSSVRAIISAYNRMIKE